MLSETQEAAELRASFGGPEAVLAYLSRYTHRVGNSVPPADLPDLIRSVHDALAGTGTEVPTPAPEPAVPVKKSVTPNYLICLEDGRM